MLDARRGKAATRPEDGRCWRAVAALLRWQVAGRVDEQATLDAGHGWR